jgi:hypothetical protein
VVTLEWARSRHQSYRDLLAHGIDPSALKAALGEHRFGVTMREWEAEQGRMHAGKGRRYQDRNLSPTESDSR